MVRDRSFVAVVLAVVLALGGLSSVSSPAGAAPPSPAARWSPCHKSFGPFECATVQVPLDYDEPRGTTISLALIRLRAADPARRIGSLFVNPGGPGGSGFDLVLFAGPSLFPQEVLDRFDLVGFDPRGVARSTQLRCFGSFRQTVATFAPFPFPITDEEEAAVIEGERRFVEACDRRGSRLVEHMSTANVARDLDRLREAVGDDKLTYYGVSYGSFLGTTYANLFPGRVRAVGVDSVLDPIAWVNEGGTIPFSTRLGGAASAMATLREFFRLCDAGGQNCALAPDSEARFEALAERLRGLPVTLTDPNGATFEYGYANLIGDALGALTDPRSWSSAAEFVAALEAQATPAVLGTERAALLHRLEYSTKRGFPRYPNFAESLGAVACADTDGPQGYGAWSTAADDAEAQFGHFGRLWTWASSICAEWPFDDADRYAGPFNATTAHPVLVIGNAFDPVTPFDGALTVADLLPGSSLLTVAGWGHASIGSSQCADAHIVAYLVSQTTPPPGATCAQDFVPFAQPPGP